MSQTLSPSVARCYGLARVSRVWSVSRASGYPILPTMGHSGSSVLAGHVLPVTLRPATFGIDELHWALAKAEATPAHFQR
jgi:hypothetical protein